jgi:hypothetical protein
VYYVATVVVCALSAMLASCAREAAPPAAAIPPKPVPAPPPKAHHLEEFRAVRESLQKKIERFHAAASQHRDPGWTVQPIVRDRLAAFGRYDARWTLPLRPGKRNEHVIELSLLSKTTNLHDIGGLSLNANYFPAAGWGAMVYYTTAEGTGDFIESFGVRFARCDGPSARIQVPSEFALDLPVVACSTSVKKGDWEYRFTVTKDKERQPAARNAVNDDVVRELLTSSAGLPDAVLRDLDILEANARAQIASGVAFDTVVDWHDVRSENPPRESPRRPEHSIPPDVKQAAEKNILAELERRRQLIRVEHEALFAAAECAFPLRECIDGK